jgi:peptidoglycan/xylan/chitin deacetylase (PgdA/CDA1 family)
VIRRIVSIVGIALVVLVLAIAGLRELARSRTTQLFGRIVSRVPTPDSVVALTFDDGPVSARADSLVEILRAHGARATFFVTGAEVAAAPDAARALVAAGHELGNHTYSHRRMVLRTPGTMRSEIAHTDTLIRAAGERGPIHFRPPYGYKLAALPYLLWRADRTTVTWDVEPDSYPEVAATPDGIVTHVLARVRPGSIILLHPWYPSRATSLAAVPALIDSLHARGYQVTTVSELLARERAGASRGVR